MRPTVPIPDKPIDIFRLFFTPDLVRMITEETNRYAGEVLSPLKKEKWQPVTTKEYEALLHRLNCSYIMNMYQSVGFRR